MSLRENKYSLHIIFFLAIISLLQILPIIKYDSIYLNIYYLLIIILNVYPLYYYLLNYKNNNTVPYFYLAHLYFFLTCTLAIIYDQSPLTSIVGSSHDAISLMFYSDKINLISATGDELLFTLNLYMWGILSFNLGYILLCKFLIQKNYKFNFFEIEKDNNLYLYIGVISFILYFLLLFGDSNFVIQKLGQAKFPLLLFYIGSFQIYIIRNKSNLLIKLIFLVVILITISIEILSGLMTIPFLIVFYVYLINILLNKKFYFKQIFLVTLIFILLNTHKESYRKVVLYDYPIPDNLTKNLQNKNLFDKFIITNKRAIKKMWKDKSSIVILYKYTIENLRRLFHSYNTLLIVTKFTPDEIPFLNGKSYLTLLTKPIPRLIWPEKPREEFGRYFGITYKVLNPLDKRTSWNTPVLTEFYANYGKKGIIIGMFLLGGLFAFITRKLDFRKNNILFLISLASLYPIFFMESNLSLLIGVTFQKFILLLILSFFTIFIYKKINTQKI